MRQFCEGVGTNTIDNANASRPIREGELEVCHANGVRDVREIMIGYDGIVVATRTTAASFELEPEDIFRAISAELPEGEMPVTWDQVNPDFAAQRISMAISASNHGTPEMFEEAVFIPVCRAVLGSDTSTDTCLNLRLDNVIEMVGDYTETLARLNSDPDTMGVLGLSFYDQNRDTLQVAPAGGYCTLRSGNSLWAGALSPCWGMPQQGLPIRVFHGVAERPWRSANGQAEGSRHCLDAVEAVLEQLIEHGPGEIASVFAGAFELAMQIERERCLGAALHERTPDSYRDSALRLAKWLEENVPEGLAVFTLPEPHRRRLRTSNPMERAVQQELKRRTAKVSLRWADLPLDGPLILLSPQRGLSPAAGQRHPRRDRRTMGLRL